MLTGELAGQAAVLRFRLVNHSQHVVEEVWYPGLGGLLGFGPADKAGQTLLHPTPERKLLAPFGQHVVTYPGQNLPFVSLDNAAIRRGLYFGAHDPVARFKAIHLVEAADRGKSNVVANIVHFPFTRPGGTFEGAPVVIQFHDGDWIAGGKEIYRPWFEKTFGLVKPEQDWIRRESFFQLIMIMLPEGNINYTIRQIPQLARDGLKYGVKSLHIAGWQRGGHDNGYPYYEPDPRLGTWDDLERGHAPVPRDGREGLFLRQHPREQPGYRMVPEGTQGLRLRESPARSLLGGRLGDGHAGRAWGTPPR